ALIMRNRRGFIAQPPTDVASQYFNSVGSRFTSSEAGTGLNLSQSVNDVRGALTGHRTGRGTQTHAFGFGHELSQDETGDCDERNVIGGGERRPERLDQKCP